MYVLVPLQRDGNFYFYKGETKMAIITKAPRGTQDVLPSQSYRWQYIEKVVREVSEKFGFKEIRFPTFEHTELFTRSVGDTTDVVQKEM